MASGEVDLLILDEINNALRLKLVDLEQVLGLIRNKPLCCSWSSPAGTPTPR